MIMRRSPWIGAAHRSRRGDPARGHRRRVHCHGPGRRSRGHHPLWQSNIASSRSRVSPGSFRRRFESTIPIDLRLRTTSTGLQDVGTRDGLRVLVQAYVAWQVPGDPPTRSPVPALGAEPTRRGRAAVAQLRERRAAHHFEQLRSHRSRQHRREDGAPRRFRVAAARPDRRSGCSRSTASTSGRSASSA